MQVLLKELEVKAGPDIKLINPLNVVVVVCVIRLMEIICFSSAAASRHRQLRGMLVYRIAF